eukprot:EG_transcript_6534
MLVPVPWLVLGVAVLLTFAACWGFVAFFQAPHSRAAFPTAVAVLGLALCLWCLLLIPIDIVNINHQGNWGDYHLNTQLVKYMYYGCYGSLLLVAFILIPFAYFYHEEERMEDEPSDRLCTSLKYTTASTLLLLFFLAIALVLGFSSDKPAANLETWAKNLLLATNGGEKAVQLLIGMMALSGLLSWLLYTSFGMAYLPLALWNSKPRPDRDAVLQGQLIDVLEDIREIECRAQLTGVRPTKQERSRLERLQKRKDSLEYQQRVALRSREDGCARLCGALSPFLAAVGVAVALIVLALVLSMFLRALDCALHPAECKGSVSGASHLPNPLDTLLVLASQAFPLDYLLLCLLLLVVFSASLAAITRIGVVFFWLRLHRLYRAGTSPQGLLLACEALIFIIVTFSVSVVIITPQYLAFGHQTTVVDGVVRDCTLKDACVEGECDRCHMSQLASLVNTVNLAFPLFGVVYLWSQWLFLLAFLISIVVCLCTEMPSLLETWYPSGPETVGLMLEEEPEDLRWGPARGAGRTGP